MASYLVRTFVYNNDISLTNSYFVSVARTGCIRGLGPYFHFNCTLGSKPHPFTNTGEIWCAREDPRNALMYQTPQVEQKGNKLAAVSTCC